MSILVTSPPNPIRALVALAALLSAVCTAAERPEVVEKPEVVVGESWTYAGYQNEKKFQTKIQIQQLSDNEIHTIVIPNGNATLSKPWVFDRQWNIVEGVDARGRSIKYSPYLPAFRFPLRSGMSWKENFEWQRSSPPETDPSSRPSPKTWKDVEDQYTGDNRTFGHNRVEARVLGWEEITVPAGTYTAIKVELLSPEYVGAKAESIFSKKELFGGRIELYWYAPQVKRYVKYLSRLYVNENLVSSEGLDLAEYSDVASTKGEEQGPPHQLAHEDLELLAAIEHGNAERTLALLKQGVDPNTKDALGRTALMYAGINGQTKIIMTALLEKDANVNAKSLDGTTALIASTIFSDPDAVRLLLNHGADVDARDNKGHSALDWALLRLRTAPNDRSLLNFRERNQYGDLTMATAKEVHEVIEVLKAAGAKE